MSFTISGGNKNALIKITEKREGDLLFLFVNMTLPEAQIP